MSKIPGTHFLRLRKKWCSKDHDFDLVVKNDLEIEFVLVGGVCVLARK